VHDLLHHLAVAGVDGVPHVLGMDDDGREVLTYLPGRTISPDSEVPADDVLTGAAAWLRRFHDAVRNYDPGPQIWRQGSAALEPGWVICHNDTGCYNWIVDRNGFAGMIDWDQAGPGDPLDDLAFLCWSGAGLYRSAPAQLDHAVAARRVRLAAEAYGGVEPSQLLDAVADRMSRAAARIAAGIARGDPGMLALRASGEPARTRERVAGFVAAAPLIAEQL
jgi:aminoglycoside phosphotransferase